MADRPILFSAPMVRALLAGRKTVTRRLCDLKGATAPVIDMVKVATDKATGRSVWEMRDGAGGFVSIRAGRHTMSPHFLPRYAVGDRLWVREAWRTSALYDETAPRYLNQGAFIHYEADGSGDKRIGRENLHSFGRLRASMHMPRWTSRLTLNVTDVRVQRLHDMTEADAIAEGIERENVIVDIVCHGGPPIEIYADRYFYDGGPEEGDPDAVEAFGDLWDSINGRGAFAADPWVYATSFTVARGNIDAVTP